MYMYYSEQPIILNYRSIKSILSHDNNTTELLAPLHAENSRKAKCIDSGQPERTAQADLSRYFFADTSSPLFT